MLDPVNPLTTPTPSFCAAFGEVDHVFGGPDVDLRRVAVAPNIRRQDHLVPRVDVVQHRLADQMVADGEHLEVVLFQKLAFLGAVVVLVEGFIDLEVVAPAGQFKPVVSEAAALASQFGQGQVCPLAREHRDRSSHFAKLLLANVAWGGVETA